MNTNQIAFLDIEGYPDSQEHRFGILYNTLSYTTTSASEVKTILEDQPPRFICGHNFVEHDYEITKKYSLNQCINRTRIIDTLALSMLLHPGKKSHKLDKPYRSEIQLENFPAADCEQTRQLLLILKDDYLSLSSDLRDSLHLLLKEHPLYQSFFEAINYLPHKQISTLELLSKKSHLEREILNNLIHEYPVECGILCTQLYSENKNNFSRIIIERYPELPRLKAQILFDVSKTSELVQKYAETEFGFGTFREFPTLQNGLFTLSQKTIIESAVQGKSFLCVLPTGGGKTFTFQLPAIIKADFCKTLTVVISPLQALMKNHTDNFNNQIQNFKSAALSGFLDPISRINTLEEIHNGTIDILYLAPEALRSNVVFKALQSRVIERFVIDEAHCFSAWGHDFRHDYFYIRECLAELQKSDYQPPIPVSCFTATARPNVLKDISNYFQDVLSEQLEEYIASSERTNLNYSAIAVDNQAEKYNRLIDLITLYKEKAIIIYRPQNARGCKELAKKLQLDERINHFNLVIEPFYSKMDEDDDRPLEERRKNQVLDDFIINNVNIVIATTAFGMGIDKPDIEAVIHYDPSDSLESYMQESGRGARSSHIQAECVVLYTEKDFARIFQTQNRSKLQYDEIDRVARFCKKNNRRKFQSSTRTIAQGIGIDTEDTAQDFDTLIKTAILELEKWKIIKRGRNRTKIFATSILLPAKEDNRLPMEIVHEKLDPHREEYGTHYPMMIELMNNIIQKSKTDPVEIEALADIIGISKKDIFEIVLKLQEAELLDFYNDISVLIDDNITTNLQKHFELEDKILQVIKEEQNNHKIDLRLFHDDSFGDDWLQRVSRIINSWRAIGPIVQDKFKFRIHKFHCSFHLTDESYHQLVNWKNIRKQICQIISQHCLQNKSMDEDEVEFSSNELYSIINAECRMSLEFYHHSLVYLHENMNGFDIHRGRLIYYQGISLQKQEKLYERSVPYYKGEYKESLERYYQNKIEAIHILQEFYKNLEAEGWQSQKKFVQDYFELDYPEFLKKYDFDQKLLKLAVTEKGFQRIQSELNEEQKKIVNDQESKAILVLAGPGSGKTKTLVHKIASLITIENNKPEYFLMLTHSRVAARDFNQRLYNLIGPLALSVEIMTFHAYASLIVGHIIESEHDLDLLIPKAIQLIENEKFKPKLKTMLVLDEFQDIGSNMYKFVQVIYSHMAKDKRIIAVGDDDQCINNFGNEKADPLYMEKFREDFIIQEEEQVIPVQISHLLNNYRSDYRLVGFTNSIARKLPNRQKDEDLIAISEEEGVITLTEYPKEHMDKSYITQMAKDVIQDNSKNIAVLLRSNEEVLCMYSLLKLQGCTVQYITNTDGFQLGNIVELQDFLMTWKDSGSYSTARTELDQRYFYSKNYHIAVQVIDDLTKGKDLEELNKNHLLHCHDFSEQLQHIQFEEYIQTDSRITVSTMHKSKGREFHTVYTGINGHTGRDPFSKRLFYVAMTRAKKELHIHSSKGTFQDFKGQFNHSRFISQKLPESNKITISMNLGDLWLSNSTVVEGIIKANPMAGEHISIIKKENNDSVRFELRKGNHIVGILAKPASKGNTPNCAARILDLEEKGYSLEQSCEIENVIYWEDKNNENKKYCQVLCLVVMCR